MSLKAKFLKMSLKNQIIIAILICCILSVLYIITIFAVYILIIQELAEDRFKAYFYTTQKEILESMINFQNLYIFNYEDFIKTMIFQIALIKRIDLNMDKFDSVSKYFSIQKAENADSNESYFYYLGEEDAIYDPNDENKLKPMISVINYFREFRVPYYGDDSLFQGMLVYSNKTKKVYSKNQKFLIDFVNSYIPNNNFQEYYQNQTQIITNSCIKIFDDHLAGRNSFYDLYIGVGLVSFFNGYKITKDFSNYAHSCPYVDYKTDTFQSMRINVKSDEFFITTKLKQFYIGTILVQLSKLYDITSIMTIYPDNEVLNLVQCYALFYKLLLYLFYEKKDVDFNELFRTLLNKKFIEISAKNFTVDKCLVEFDDDNIIEYYLKKNATFFFDDYWTIDTLFIQLMENKLGKKFAISKYTYPDYFTMKLKKPQYFISSYLNVYTFMNFYCSSLYLNTKHNFYQINYLTIILSNWYFWIFIIILFIIITLNMSKEITEPLIKLKEAIEQRSFKDEKIFEYKNDDIINQLFKMCKDLFVDGDLNKCLKSKNCDEKDGMINDELYNLDLDDNNSTNYSSKRVNRLNNNLTINNEMIKNITQINIEKNNKDKQIYLYEDKPKKSSYIPPKIRSRHSSKKKQKLKKINSFNNQKWFPEKNKKDYTFTSRLLESFQNYDEEDVKMSPNNIELKNSLTPEVNKLKLNDIDKNKKMEKKEKKEEDLSLLSYEILFELGELFFTFKEKPYLKSKSIEPIKKVNNFFISNFNQKTIKNTILNNMMFKYNSYDSNEKSTQNNINTLSITKEFKLNEEENFDDKENNNNNNNKDIKKIIKRKKSKNIMYSWYANAEREGKYKFLKTKKDIYTLNLKNDLFEQEDLEENKKNAIKIDNQSIKKVSYFSINSQEKLKGVLKKESTNSSLIEGIKKIKIVKTNEDKNQKNYSTIDMVNKRKSISIKFKRKQTGKLGPG